MAEEIPGRCDLLFRILVAFCLKHHLIAVSVSFWQFRWYNQTVVARSAAVRGDIPRPRRGCVGITGERQLYDSVLWGQGQEGVGNRYQESRLQDTHMWRKGSYIKSMFNYIHLYYTSNSLQPIVSKHSPHVMAYYEAIVNPTSKISNNALLLNKQRLSVW